VRACQPSVSAGFERDGGRRIPVGPPRQQHGRLQFARLPRAVFVQIQLQVHAGRLIMKGVAIGARGRAVIVAIAIGAATLPLPLRAQNDVQPVVSAAFTKFKDLKAGKNADYIPALAQVDPNLFGIAVIGRDGKAYTAGDVTKEVSIQSISKVFTMARVIQELGPDAVEKTIG